VLAQRKLADGLSDLVMNHRLLGPMVEDHVPEMDMGIEAAQIGFERFHQEASTRDSPRSPER
jgi:hypothetical protein